MRIPTIAVSLTPNRILAKVKAMSAQELQEYKRVLTDLNGAYGGFDKGYANALEIIKKELRIRGLLPREESASNDSVRARSIDCGEISKKRPITKRKP